MFYLSRSSCILPRPAESMFSKLIVSGVAQFMAADSLSVFRLLSILSLLPTHQRAVSMVMMAPRDRLSGDLDAVAMVTKVRSETRVRLLLARPDRLFHQLTQPTGSENQNVIRGNMTTHEWTAVESNHDSKLLYVIDRKAQGIMAVSLVSNNYFNVFTGTSTKVYGLAVNWEDNSVYWPDAAYDSIFRYKSTAGCRLNGCLRTLVSTELSDPTGIAVHPYQSFMYWTDSTVGRLERSNLYGGGRRILFEQLSHPTALTIDLHFGRLYWLAHTGDTAVVESSDLQGHDRHSAAVFPGDRLTALAASRGLLLLTQPDHGELVIHDVNSNVTRRLSVGEVVGVCVVLSADSRRLDSSQPAMTSPSATPAESSLSLAQEGFILLASEQGVFALDKMAPTSAREVTARKIIFRESITAIAVDVGRKFLYFYDRETGAIEKATLPESDITSGRLSEVSVIVRVPGIVAGLTVDWLAETIYWADITYNRINAVTASGSHVRCMACRDVHQPRDVAVHPIKSFLFWTEVDSDNPRIQRLDLLSGHRTTVVNASGHPLALTIDYQHHMMYWSEDHHICRSDLDGRGLTSCPASSNPAPLVVKAMDILHDFLVWSDFREGVTIADKDDNFDSIFNSSRVLLPETFYNDLVYFHESRQPHFNIGLGPCATNNGGCAHFCIPTADLAKHCACATGYWKRRDGSCVTGFVENNFVIVADQLMRGIYQQYLHLPDYYVIPVRRGGRPSDVTFDIPTRKVYWSDTETRGIFRSFLNGSQQEVIFADSEIVAEKLYMAYGRQLLFFVDTTQQKVGVISLTTMSYLVIVHSFQFVFHDVVYHTGDGLIYLSASRNSELQQNVDSGAIVPMEGAILRCDVSGDGLTVVIETDSHPGGLAVGEEVLYWINKDGKTLNVLNITTGITSLIMQFPDWLEPNDIALLGDYVYLTVTKRSTLFRLNVKECADSRSLSLLEERGVAALFTIAGIASDHLPDSGQAPSQLRHHDPCRQRNVTSLSCVLLATAIERARTTTEIKICRVPNLPHGQVAQFAPGTYLISGDVIRVECQPGYGSPSTRSRNFTSECVEAAWHPEPSCVWVMAYTINASCGLDCYVIFTSSNEFIVPANVTYLDVIVIGGGGGGFQICSPEMANLTRAGDGGLSRLGRYLRAAGGRGGTPHAGGRGGFGTVFFGGPGEISSGCQGGGAAGQTSRADHCQLSSGRCPFCGAGGAPVGCSLCPDRSGGCRGPWALPGQGINADSFGGGATGLAGGGGGGGGGYSRRYVDVTPGEVIPVTIGRGGVPSAGVAGHGVVVIGWGGRLEDVLPSPEALTCRPFAWSADPGQEPMAWDTCPQYGNADVQP